MSKLIVAVTVVIIVAGQVVDAQESKKVDTSIALGLFVVR